MSAATTPGTAPAAQASAAPVPGIAGVSHVAVNTADLQRFRRFYEGTLGLRLGVVVRMDHPPYLRHATFAVGSGAVLHVFEVPGYDPEAQGLGTDIGERGRIDHIGLWAHDRAALDAVAARLAAAGASDGEVRPLGPVLSVFFRDPDGVAMEVNCPNPGFDPDADEGETTLEVGDPDWLADVGPVAAAR